ncbi:sigma-70 family RNA polymerase sigma factor [candidate division KSB1 bacterium]|nr:sigma-70 family RNA polymerase sigma factor [candidate division KSB1 bacterium]
MNVRTNEDIVQKALMVICQKYKYEKFKKGIIPYAYGVLDKIIMTDYQTEERRNKILNDNIDQVLEIFEDEEIIHGDLADEVWNALNQLNNTDKQILRLKLLGYTGAEIMAEFGLSRNALDVRVFRAYKKLKLIFKKREVC